MTQLPIDWYFNEKIFQLEKSLLFDNGPGYVGHQIMVPNAGNYHSLEWFDNHSKLLVNAGNNDFYLMSNVCRHRQAIMLKGDGKFDKNKGILEDYLLKNEKNNMSKVVKEGTKNSKLASLDYEVLKYNEEINLSVLKINLHTGRHHQIRVQLSSRNHSIYGDQKYGGRGHGKQICLWAYELTVQHPITKEEMSFKALPEKEKSWKILEDIKGLD